VNAKESVQAALYGQDTVSEACAGSVPCTIGMNGHDNTHRPPRERNILITQLQVVCHVVCNLVFSSRRGSAQYLPVWLLIINEIRNAQTRCFCIQAVLKLAQRIKGDVATSVQRSQPLMQDHP
jgi:hypothetical protein